MKAKADDGKFWDDYVSTWRKIASTPAEPSGMCQQLMSPLESSPTSKFLQRRNLSAPPMFRGTSKTLSSAASSTSTVMSDTAPSKKRDKNASKAATINDNNHIHKMRSLYGLEKNLDGGSPSSNSHNNGGHTARSHKSISNHPQQLLNDFGLRPQIWELLQQKGQKTPSVCSPIGSPLQSNRWQSSMFESEKNTGFMKISIQPRMPQASPGSYNYSFNNNGIRNANNSRLASRGGKTIADEDEIDTLLQWAEGLSVDKMI